MRLSGPASRAGGRGRWGETVSRGGGPSSGGRRDPRRDRPAACRPGLGGATVHAADEGRDVRTTFAWWAAPPGGVALLQARVGPRSGGGPAGSPDGDAGVDPRAALMGDAGVD